MSLDAALGELNARLKAGRHRCRIERRGTSLCLRATLPERESPSTRRQQRIALNLSATYTSFPEAEAAAIRLSLSLLRGTFAWEDWTHDSTGETSPTVEAFIAGAERLIATKYRSKDPERQALNWRKNWLPALRKLPPSGPVTEATLLRVVRRMPENGSARFNQGRILAQIAESFGIPSTALRQLSRGYGVAQLAPRSIPEDAQIEALLDRLSSHWQWSFGMLAAYGLRPHELERIAPTTGNLFAVDVRSKTGARIVHPCPSAWVGRFDLLTIRRPPPSVEEMSVRLSAVLKRQAAGFTSYGLRHAYAIRLMDRGVPPEIGCRLMGHSLVVHEARYKRWIDQNKVSELAQRFNL